MLAVDKELVHAVVTPGWRLFVSITIPIQVRLDAAKCTLEIAPVAALETIKGHRKYRPDVPSGWRCWHDPVSLDEAYSNR